MEILVRALHPDAVLPQNAHEHDAGFDLVAVESCTLARRGGRATVGTGLSIAIPEGRGGLVLPLSLIHIFVSITRGPADSGYLECRARPRELRRRNARTR